MSDEDDGSVRIYAAPPSRGRSAGAVLLDEQQTGATRRAALTEQSWYRWLRPYSWDVFVTGTFEHEQSAAGALRLAEHFISRLEKHVCRNVLYAGVVETAQPRVHMHMLLGGVGDRFVEKRIGPHWPLGRLHVVPATRPRVRYMAKKLVHEPLELLPSDLDARVNRLRRKSRTIRRLYGARP